MTRKELALTVRAMTKTDLEFLVTTWYARFADPLDAADAAQERGDDPGLSEARYERMDEVLRAFEEHVLAVDLASGRRATDLDDPEYSRFPGSNQ